MPTRLMVHGRSEDENSNTNIKLFNMDRHNCTVRSFLTVGRTEGQGGQSLKHVCGGTRTLLIPCPS
jgi:hypothetical protein